MQSNTRKKNSKKRWIGRVLLKSVAPEEPMPIASVHPMVVGRSDALALVQVWVPNGIKPSQALGTGWTDGVKRGIGAFNVPCSRDDVKCQGAKSSLPEEPVPTGVKHRSNDVSKSNGYVTVQRDRFNRWLSISLTDGYWVSSRQCVRSSTATSGLRETS